MKDTYYNEQYYQNGDLAYEGMGYDDYRGYFVRHGRGKLYLENGTLLYEGEFRDGVPNGRGKLYCEDGMLSYEGDYRDGAPNGRGKEYREDGTLCYEGEFRDCERNGRGKFYREDGTLLYEGEFRDGVPNGRGKEYHEDGTLWYEGEYHDNERNGRGKEYREDGTLCYEGEYRDGKAVQAAATAAKRNRTIDDAMRELDEMTGLVEVKAQVHALVNLIRVQNERRARNLPIMPMSFHLVFTGNPGTGKTSVARLIAEIYADLGIVTKGTLVETDRSGLVAGYLGQTAIKTEKVINEAKGGVLFIDEAYSLAQDSEDSYGREAIDCLMKRMEDARGDFAVIAAGYKEPMDRFLEANPGMKSRFNRHIHFDNYSLSELMEILDHFCEKNGYTMEPSCRKVFSEKLELRMKDKEFMKTFSNGRYVRNLFEKLVFAQSNRLSQADIGSVETHYLTMISLQNLKYIISHNEFEKTF